MDIFRASERLMGMDDTVWARHANPASGLTRLFAAPIVFLAAWSFFWIGLWGMVPAALACAWIWLNPRLFPPPERADSWMARGVLGERAYLNRRRVPIPHEHARMATVATLSSVLFIVLCVVGFLRQDFWLAATGYHAAVLGKVWFVDRMAWLWDDMKSQTELYRAWAMADWSAHSA
ncbi:MAG: DUF6653 family protein [Pseudomonadota bacterium]